MLQEAIYERQNLIGELDIPNIATVVGLGGTGFWTAVFLAMSGVSELILIDADTIEVSNLNRLPLKESFVGMNKTQAVKDFLSEIRKLTRIEIHNLKIVKPEDCQILRGAIFCCTDNLRSQQLICAYCNKNALFYQRIGYDGTILNVSKTFPLSFEEIKDEGGYTATPSWVIPAVFAAAAGVASKAYKELCLMDDLGKVHIQNSSHVPEKILDDAREEEKEYIIENISDYLPDGYGCCDNCSHCDDCSRVNLDDGYGYCSDCEDHYTEDDIEKIKEEAQAKCLDDLIEQIEQDEISDRKFKRVLEKWAKKKVNQKGGEVPCLA